MVLGLEAMTPELQTIALTMYLLMGLCTSLFIFIMVIWWGTRGWLKPLVKAKIGGKSLLLNLSRDKKLKLEAVENIAGMYKGKAGEYMINPESVYHNPAGVPTSIGYEHLGATLNPKHIFFLQKILSEGIPLKEVIYKKDEKGKIALDSDNKPIVERVKEYKKRIENIEELEEFAEKFKKQTGEDAFITHQGETLRIQDMLNFSKYDTNPSLMEAKIENKLARERQEERKLPWKMFLVITPFMFTMVLCFIIIISFINSQSSVQQLTQCTNQLGTAQVDLIKCNARLPVIGGGTAGGTEIPMS